MSAYDYFSNEECPPNNMVHSFRRCDCFCNLLRSAGTRECRYMRSLSGQLELFDELFLLKASLSPLPPSNISIYHPHPFQKHPPSFHVFNMHFSNNLVGLFLLMAAPVMGGPDGTCTWSGFGETGFRVCIYIYIYKKPKKQKVINVLTKNRPNTLPIRPTLWHSAQRCQTNTGPRVYTVQESPRILTREKSACMFFP